MTTLRYLMATHFPTCHVVATYSPKYLSSVAYDHERSSSKKILWRREKSRWLSQRAHSRSPNDQKQIKRVNCYPNQSLSRLIFRKSKASQRKEIMPIWHHYWVLEMEVPSPSSLMPYPTSCTPR